MTVVFIVLCFILFIFKIVLYFKISFLRYNLHTMKITNLNVELGFPGGAVVKNPPANAGDTGLSPGLGRSHMLQNN